MIAFSLDNENVIRIADTIAYRYCNHKRRESIIAIEYIKTCTNKIKFDYQIFKECFSYDKSVLSFVESVVDIPSEPVYDFTTVSDNHSFVANGIVSHNCIPSRMTVNQLMECVLGKACAIDGTYGDATPFTSSSTGNAAERICEMLAKAGMKQTLAYERTGWETMYNGMTGEPIKAKVFMGPTYYQRLKHMVADKIHSRAHGHVTTLTRQPLEGRSRDGGQSGHSGEKFYKSYFKHWPHCQKKYEVKMKTLLVCGIAGYTAKLRRPLVMFPVPSYQRNLVVALVNH